MPEIIPAILASQGFSLGIVASLLFSEALGITAGGIVVPGYLALQTSRPLALVGTLLVALVTFGFIRLFSRFILLYGHRRLVITLLAAIVFDTLLGRFLSARFVAESLGFITIGQIMPGLMAGWMDVQGVVRTIAALIVVIVMVSLVLIMIHGESYPFPFGAL